MNIDIRTRSLVNVNINTIMEKLVARNIVSSSMSGKLLFDISEKLVLLKRRSCGLTYTKINKPDLEIKLKNTFKFFANL